MNLLTMAAPKVRRRSGEVWNLQKNYIKYDYQQQLDKNQRQNAATATVTATAATNNNVSGKLGNDSQN